MSSSMDKNDCELIHVVMLCHCEFCCSKTGLLTSRLQSYCSPWAENVKVVLFGGKSVGLEAEENRTQGSSLMS